MIKMPEDINAIFLKCCCPVCKSYLEYGQLTTDYQYIPLLLSPSFPMLREGQNAHSSEFELACALDPEHKVQGVITAEESAKLLNWLLANEQS